MDKNTIIGFVLMGVLFFAFFWYTNSQQKALHDQQAHVADSIAKVNASKIKPVDTATARMDSLRNDSLKQVTEAGGFSNAANGSEQLTTVENAVMKVVFSNKGGQVKSVQLKKFLAPDSTPVVLSGGKTDVLGYTINTSSNQSAETNNLFFKAVAPVKNGDGSQTITYTLEGASGQTITHQYMVRANDYLIDWNILLNGANRLLSQNTLNIHWNVLMRQQQSSLQYEKEQSRLCFYDDADHYDFERAPNGAVKDFNGATNWVTFKQQFFNTTILAKSKFSGGRAEMTSIPDTSTHNLYNATAGMRIPVQPATAATVALQLYYGPNDYHVMKAYNNEMENIVDLGSGIFSFVKYINRWIIMPVFTFLSGFVSNYGWAIALLTLFIRLVTSPLLYKSYLSGAKMRVLRPELDELKKKHGDNQQAFAMDQMKLLNEAGASPLGGCLPALLQIPIFFSLYSFFSSEILLRGQSFLWARDLSTYDVIAKLPFSIPFGFGDHISLFTLTAIITSFLISIYNMSATPDQSNPALKYMPYIFPFILLFVFNRLPSALTWYYTVSNLITLGLQFVIQNYIIDQKKIHAEIQEKRKSPKTKTKSKWQERFEQMQESQKKLQEMKQRTQGRK